MEDLPNDLGIPEWVIHKMAAAETIMRCELNTNQVKILYWMHYGKSQAWIAEALGRELGTVKNLMSKALKALKQTEDIGPQAESPHFFKEAMFLILDEMIFHSFENIDVNWPPPLRIMWVYHLAQNPALYVRFSLCYDYRPTSPLNVEALYK